MSSLDGGGGEKPAVTFPFSRSEFRRARIAALQHATNEKKPMYVLEPRSSIGPLGLCVARVEDFEGVKKRLIEHTSNVVRVDVLERWNPAHWN